MKIIVVILLVLVAVLIISLIPLRFRFRYCKEGKNDLISITWQLVPGIWGITAEVPFIKVSSRALWPTLEMIARVEGEGGTPMAEGEKCIAFNLPRIKKLIKLLPDIFNKLGEWRVLGKWLLSKISVRDFSWITEIGTGDAGKTGILTGLIWAIKGLVYCYGQTLVRKAPPKPQINVIPNFQGPVAGWNLECIFDVSCGHIIIGGIKALYILRKRW